MDLVLNNLQKLICYKTQTNQQTFKKWVLLSIAYSLRDTLPSSNIWLIYSDQGILIGQII